VQYLVCNNCHTHDEMEQRNRKAQLAPALQAIITQLKRACALDPANTALAKNLEVVQSIAAQEGVAGTSPAPVAPQPAPAAPRPAPAVPRPATAAPVRPAPAAARRPAAAIGTRPASLGLHMLAALIDFAIAAGLSYWWFQSIDLVILPVMVYYLVAGLFRRTLGEAITRTRVVMAGSGLPAQRLVYLWREIVYVAVLLTFMSVWWVRS
jgi:hypothetical protein